MKRILLWIAGIVLVIVIIALALTAQSPFWGSDSGFQLQEMDFDSAMVPSKGMRTPGQAPLPASAFDGDEMANSMGTSAMDRVVIRSARLSIVTKDVQEAADSLKQYAESNGGFVVNAAVRTEEGVPPSATVSFRVPVEKLDATVAFVRQQAMRVVSESITGEDVTEEYVDLTARLKNLTASETQLLAIMRDARKTEDVLAVHREIERVRAEIESLTGRKKYLDESAKLSFVTVSIATDESSLPVIESGNEWRPLVVAKGAVTAFLGVLRFLANFAIWIIIFVPVWGTVILVARYWKKRRKTASVN